MVFAREERGFAANSLAKRVLSREDQNLEFDQAVSGFRLSRKGVAVKPSLSGLDDRCCQTNADLVELIVPPDHAERAAMLQLQRMACKVRVSVRVHCVRSAPNSRLRIAANPGGPNKNNERDCPENGGGGVESAAVEDAEQFKFHAAQCQGTMRKDLIGREPAQELGYSSISHMRHSGL